VATTRPWRVSEKLFYTSERLGPTAVGCNSWEGGGHNLVKIPALVEPTMRLSRNSAARLKKKLFGTSRNEGTGGMPDTLRQRGYQRRYAHISLDWGLLPLLMILTPLIYLFRTRYNLPVAANVDERASLAVLLRFHNGSLNPHFFMYPTLYYYTTYFFIDLFPISHILVWGRILNLSFVGLTAFIAYSFARLHFLSRVVGILSASFIISSTTMINSGSYICPDALLAAATLATLLFLMQYFQKPTTHRWIAAMIVLGLAIGCKYTAFLLFVAYVGAEMISELQRTDSHNDRESESHISRNALTVAFTVGGLLLLTCAWLFPLTTLVQFASKHHTNVDLTAPADYVAFFHNVRMDLICGGITILIAAVVVMRSRISYRLFSLTRLYLGLGVVLLVALLTTPFSVVDPSKFIYDIGALARETVLVDSGNAQWKHYAGWLLRNESTTLLLLGLAGFFTVIGKDYRRYAVVILFVTLYLFVIGSAHMGFPRYLTPLLPLVYIFAAGFLMQVWTAHAPTLSPYLKTLAVLLVVIATSEIWPRIASSLALSNQRDEFWSSYSFVISTYPTKVLYAGYAPSVELSAAGISVSPVSWDTLGQRPVGAQLDCGELLMFDRRTAETHFVVPESDPSLTTLLDRSGSYGQEVLGKAGCKSSLPR
jgi:hypothetical protein